MRDYEHCVKRLRNVFYDTEVAENKKSCGLVRIQLPIYYDLFMACFAAWIICTSCQLLKLLVSKIIFSFFPISTIMYCFMYVRILRTLKMKFYLIKHAKKRKLFPIGHKLILIKMSKSKHIPLPLLTQRTVTC